MPLQERIPKLVRGRLGLVLVLLLLGVWQLGVFERRASLETRYREDSAVGMCPKPWSRFFHFYYHFGVFPVSLNPRARDVSRAGLEAALAHRGQDLVMSAGACAVGSGGDYSRILLFLPNAWAHGGSDRASIRPVVAALFASALAALLTSFWCQGLRGLGIFVVSCVGSSPFLLYEAYANENVFSVAVSASLLALALNLRFLRTTGRARWTDFVLAIATGVGVTSLREVRTEAAFALLSVLGTYALTGWLSKGRRAALAGTALASFVLASFLFGHFASRAHARAVDFVRSHGGHVYQGPRARQHPLWHTVCAGLGDFGRGRGFSWSDADNYAWAAPALRERGLEITYTSGLFFDQAFDEAGVYRIKPELFPEYVDVVRTRFLDAVRGDPLWYAGILMRRGQRILSETSPLGLHWLGGQVVVPWPGWIALFALAFLVWKREGFLVRLVLFTAPLSLVPLLIYSAQGATYHALYHVFALAALVQLALRALERRHSSIRPTESQST